MYLLVNVLGPPSLVLLLFLGIRAYKIRETVFFNRLTVGAWGGLVSTFAYDLSRYLGLEAGIFTHNPFLSHPVFGSLITGQPVASSLAAIVGWGYHFWNGFGFGIMYTLLAGNARWYYAVLWAMFLEVGWLTVLPATLPQLKLDGEWIAISLSGHGMYGVVLGLISERFIRA